MFSKFGVGCYLLNRGLTRTHARTHARTHTHTHTHTKLQMSPITLPTHCYRRVGNYFDRCGLRNRTSAPTSVLNCTVSLSSNVRLLTVAIEGLRALTL